MNGSPAYLRAPALACRITGRTGFVGGLHHSLHLLEVVDVESRNAVRCSAAWSSNWRMETRGMK
jgi:hypothetical protein